MNYISLLSTVISFIFAGSVLARWRHKKPPYLLLWGIGLIFYGLGTLCEVILSVTFSPWILKLWYLTGAMLTAAWLGQGTIYLLVRKRGVANALMVALGLTSLLSFFLVAAAPVTDAAAAYVLHLPASEQYKEILIRNGLIVFLTILLNVYGTIGLVGGALYSAFLFWRKSILVNRMLGNLLIAAGALMPAMAGSFVRAGLVDWLYFSELLGVILMYAGFMLATATRPLKNQQAAPLSPGD